MCGYFHQFPPVAVGCSENIFTLTENEEVSHPKVIGQKIYEEFCKGNCQVEFNQI